MKAISQNIAKIVKKLIVFISCGVVFMWLTFWYMFGTSGALFNFIFTYATSTQYFYKPVSKTALMDGMLAGMVSSLKDPHSMYLTPKLYTRLKEHTEGKFVGIGIVMAKSENGVTVVKVLKGSPAEKVGIKPGDTITAVNHESIAKTPFEDIPTLIRGKKNTTVDLTIERNHEEKQITVTREQIIVPSVEGTMKADGIAYIRIDQFGTNTDTEFEKIYNRLEKEGMKALVLDMRSNPGGLLKESVAVGDYLLPKGPVVTVKSRFSKEEYLSKGLREPIPVVVLMDQNSASAAEILAAAIQDRKVGVVLGSKSYGKGTVQSIIPGVDNNAVKVTIAQYHTAADRVIDGKGVYPDVEMKPIPASEYSDHDAMVQKAEAILAEKLSKNN